MSDPRHDELPPLGEPTPGPVAAPRRWHAHAGLVAVGALVVGLGAGFFLGRATEDDGEPPRATDRTSVQTTLATTTTTRVELVVPQECRDAMRSAEQALGLLDQGFESLRGFEVGEIERVLGEMQRLRDVLGARVRECLENT